MTLKELFSHVAELLDYMNEIDHYYDVLAILKIHPEPEEIPIERIYFIQEKFDSMMFKADKKSKYLAWILRKNHSFVFSNLPINSIHLPEDLTTTV